MEKLCHVLWRRPDADPAELRSFLLDDAAPRLLALDCVRGLRLTIEDPDGSWMRRGAQPDGSLLAATVSTWVPSLDEREPLSLIVHEAPAAAVHAWLATESVPLDYGERRTWPDGERSPGKSITTVLDQRPGLSDEGFFGIWHGEHTPLTFEIHPVWSYVRNTLWRSLSSGAPSLRALVYESVPDPADLYDLHRFFGSGGDDDALQRAIARVDAHVATFADPASLQTTPTDEWILRSLPG
jgi:hypothetical protein